MTDEDPSYYAIGFLTIIIITFTPYNIHKENVTFLIVYYVINYYYLSENKM